MKNLLSSFLLLLAGAVTAQSFEGTIKWSMKMEITDPEMKAKMEEGIKKMNDPQTQAQLKMMQEKLNDPQMKKMMDANPAMKQQMENSLKALQGSGGNMNSMMPQGITTKMKNNNVLTKIEGGMMPMEILYQAGTEQGYRLDREHKTYVVMKGGTKPADDKAAPKVTKTSETMKILNYTCTKYIVEFADAQHTMKNVIWATTEIKDIDVKALAKQRMDRGRGMIYEGIDGIPLRVESSTKEGTMTMEVTEINREALPASDFVLPADFREVN